MRWFAVLTVLLLAPAFAAEAISTLVEHQGKRVLVKNDTEVDPEFAGIDLVLTVKEAEQKASGKPPDLAALKTFALLVCETERERAYVHYWIGLRHIEREDYDRAIEVLEAGLPLAGEDRGKESLYFAILSGLLHAYDKSGRFPESMPYLKLYREIITAGIDPWQRFEGSEDVVHKPSGIRLPQKLGIFTRNRLVVFDDTGRDAGANYELSNGAQLTVFVVAEFTEEAEAHFTGAMRLMLQRFEGSTEVSRGSLSVASAKGRIDGWAGSVRVPAAGDRPPLLSGVSLLSDLYVFKRAGTLIKFRMTYRESDRSDVAGYFKTALERFDWP